MNGKSNGKRKMGNISGGVIGCCCVCCFHVPSPTLSNLLGYGGSGVGSAHDDKKLFLKEESQC